jgi:hypothetical protein
MNKRHRSLKHRKKLEFLSKIIIGGLKAELKRICLEPRWGREMRLKHRAKNIIKRLRYYGAYDKGLQHMVKQNLVLDGTVK